MEFHEYWAKSSPQNIEQQLWKLPQMDEEQVLSLSSPEPELDHLLFPLRQDSHPSPPQALPVEEIKSEDSVFTSDDPQTTTVDDIMGPDQLKVSLLHKPRGCKGVWQRVDEQDALRVTKGKGKWLKLEISYSPTNVIRASSTEVFLVDMNSASKRELIHSEEEGITIETSSDNEEGGRSVIEVELKLDRVCRRLQFFVSCRTSIGVLRGRSPIFSAHNNGKASHKQKGSDEAQTITHDQVHNRDSSNSPPNVPDNKKKRRTPPEQQEIPSMMYPVPPMPQPYIYNQFIEDPGTVVPGNLRVNGVVRAKAFLQFSDLRLKANVADLVDAVNIVKQLEGKTYTWKKGADFFGGQSGGKRVIGLIAQEVRKIVPEVVHEDENGILSVSYAELIPIVIEALKEHIKEFEKHKQGVNSQLEDLQQQLDYLAHKHDQETRELKAQVNFPRPVVVYQTPVNNKAAPVVKAETKKRSGYRRTTLRSGVMIMFLLGLASVILGAVMLGITISGPKQLLTTSVIDAKNLKDMDRDGAPDPYCEVHVGSQLFKTQTVWNSANPVFMQTFSAPLDETVSRIVYQLYDNDQNPAFPPRRMGVAYFSLKDNSLTVGETMEKWIDLVPNLRDDSVSGQLHVELHISEPSEPGFELALLGTGIFLTSLSVFVGFYVWKSAKIIYRIES